MKALEFILAGFEAGREPTNTEISQKANIGTRELGRMLGKLGIVTKTVTRQGKTFRVYGMELNRR